MYCCDWLVKLKKIINLNKCSIFLYHSVRFQSLLVVDVTSPISNFFEMIKNQRVKFKSFRCTEFCLSFQKICVKAIIWKKNCCLSSLPSTINSSMYTPQFTSTYKRRKKALICGKIPLIKAVKYSYVHLFFLYIYFAAYTMIASQYQSSRLWRFNVM